MTTIERLRRILNETLALGPRGAALKREDRLLGGLPEFDSMAVVSLVTAIEEQFEITIADDELSGEVFETLGSLESFVSARVRN